MSHQVQINYTAKAIACESLCEVAEKQIEELEKMLAEMESGSTTLINRRVVALKQTIEREKESLVKRMDDLRQKAKKVAERGIVNWESSDPDDNVDMRAEELKKQVNNMASKRIVDMRALLQMLLAESIEENQRKLINKGNGVVIVTEEIQKLIDSLPDEIDRQYTYLAYVKDDTLSGEDLIKAGIALKSETYESRIEQEREKIRRELESAKVDKTIIENVVADNKSLSEIRADATEEIVGEKVRQKSLKIIMAAISARGFIVDKKNIKIKNDTNEVILVGLKASGEKAEFRVFMDGKFIYNFRGYEGQACQKDIQPFLNDLEDVYGLHVTKTQEIWSNPDKISTMKYQTVKTNKNKR